MTLRVKVRQGGASGSITRDFSDKVQLFGRYSFHVGMQFGSGSAGQSTVQMVDEENLVRTTGTWQLNAHNVVWVTEDAPGSEVWLHRGRVARKDFGRGHDKAAVTRTITLISEDGNVDVAGLALTEPWVRGSETGTERAMAAIVAFCQESPRLTTNITAKRWDDVDPHLVKPHPTDGEVTMPAVTYPGGTEVFEIIRDCAENEGQEWGIVLHHEGGSHLCFMWTEEDDWDTYPCTLSINDTAYDGITAFQPIFDSSAALLEDGQELLSGIVSKWGTGDDAYVVLLNESSADTNDYWVEKVNDATSVTEAQATTRAGHLRAGRAHEHRTTQVTLQIPADMVDLVCAGMSIDIRSSTARAEEALGASVTRRIAEVQWEPRAPAEDDDGLFYYAHLKLDRPVKIARTKRSSATLKAATPGSSGTADVLFAWDWDDGNAHVIPEIVSLGQAATTSPSSSWTVNAGGYLDDLATDRNLPSSAETQAAAAVVAGTDYTFTASIRNANPPVILNAGIRLRWYSGSFGAYVLVSDEAWLDVGLAADFTAVSGTFTAPVGATSVQLRGRGGTEIDSASLTGPESGAVEGDGPAEEVGTTTDTAALSDHNHQHDNLLSRSNPEAHPQYALAADVVVGEFVKARDGGEEIVNTVAASGTTETLDLADGNVHDVTLTDNCTFTFAGATNGVSCSMLLILRQDGTGSRSVTWPGSVSWPDDTAPTLATGANDVDILSFVSVDGGTTWYGAYAGSGTAVAALDDLTDVTITSPATADLLRYNGSAWVNVAATDTGHWEVLMAEGAADPPDPLETGDGLDWLYVWVTD